MFGLGIVGMMLNGLWMWLKADNRGDNEPPKDPPKEVPKTFTQDQLNQIVEDRLARERTKYVDYDELRTFKTEHQKQLDVQTQKDLETRKEYDTAKSNYEKQVKDLQGVVTQKDVSINDLHITHALTSELSKQKGYIEEATALLKPVAVIKDGIVLIKSKDANGIEVTLPVAEGVKQFLAGRPYLVQAQNRSGGGSGGGEHTAEAPGTDDLKSLNEQLQQAVISRDNKRVGELRTQITAALAAKGIRR
jgi:hypothetical protein